MRRLSMPALALTIAAAVVPRPAAAETSGSGLYVVSGGARQSACPPEAGQHYTEGWRAAWEALTQEERDAIWSDFHSYVGPELQQAEQDYQSSAAATDPAAPLAPAPEPLQPVANPLPPDEGGGNADPSGGGGGEPWSPGKGGIFKFIDNDGDGLHDPFEKQVADNFTPGYFISRFERGGTGLALFADTTQSETPVQVFPTSGPPVVTSYYRVTPLGVVNKVGYLQIDYLTLWNRDDGVAVNASCLGTIDVLDFFGIWSPAFITGLGHHDLDRERSAVRIAAPFTKTGYSQDPAAYKIDRIFTAAHELTPVDRSDFAHIEPPLGPVAHFAEFASLSKHGTYLFWPHGQVSLLPGWAVASLYGGVSFACFFVSPATCDFLFFLADEIYFDCMVEKHVPQGFVFARSDLRINVGEVGRPLPGGSFIQTPTLQSKLARKFAIP